VRALAVSAVGVHCRPSLAQGVSTRNAATTNTHGAKARQPPLQPASAVCCYASVPHIQRLELLHECCHCGHGRICHIRVTFEGKNFQACSQRDVQNSNSFLASYLRSYVHMCRIDGFVKTQVVDRIWLGCAYLLFSCAKASTST
jgi:hypothetical protein